LSYFGSTAGLFGDKPSYASLCKECGKCEEKCPQKIPIPQELKLVAKEMQPCYFGSVLLLAKGYYKFRRMLTGRK
jgi:predicted aldo/keto reductase-like oxidoreductase